MKDINFSAKDGWLIFRLDTQIKEEPVDIYSLMDLRTNSILSYEIATTELSEQQANNLIQGFSRKCRWIKF